jgi:hypothetical protein
MALGKKSPAFEDSSDVAVADAPAATANVAPAAATAAPPAVAKTTALAVPTKFGNIFQDFMDKMDPLPIGTLPRLKASNGQVFNSDDTKLGAWVKLQLLSYNYRWQVSPGEDGTEAAKLLRTSFDGKSLEDGSGSIEDYVAHLKSEGYEKATCKKYLDVIGFLQEAASSTAPNIGDVVQMSLSPQSVTQFQGFMLQQSAKVSRGLVSPEGADVIYFAVDSKTLNAKTFSYFKVQADKPTA